MLDFDTMLTHVGEFGLYQKMLFIFQAPFCIFVTFVTFGQIFMQIYPQQFWCEDHFECNNGNLTPAQRQNLSLPFMASDTLCDLSDFEPGYLQTISSNERMARSQPGVCTNVSLSCIFNGTHWYSERPDAFRPHVINIRNRRSPQGYGGGTYPTAAVNDNRYAPTTTGYNSNQNYNTRPIANPNYNENNQFGPTSPPFGSTGNTNYGSNGNNGNNNYGHNRNNYGNNNSGNNGNNNNGNYGNNGNNGNNNYGNNGNNNYGNNENNNYGNNGNNNYGNNGNNNYENNGNNNYGNNGNNNYGSNNGNYGNNGNNNGNNGKNVYNPSDRDRYETNSQVDNSENRFEDKKKLQNCTDQGRFTAINLLPTTRFVFNVSHRRELPIRRKTLADCSNVDWRRRGPGNARFYSTIVTEGNWWCNAEVYITISQSIFFVGAIVGGFLIGWIADTFGRVPALVIANLIGAVGGILSTFTTDFYLFSFFRFITGMAFDNCFVMMYILVLEFCGPAYRTLVANLSIAIFYTIGTVILPGIALYINEWRIFGRVIAAPMFLALIAYFVVPESSRWLLSKGKAKRATDILRRFAKVNRKEVDEQIFVEFENGAQKLYDEISKEGPDPSLTEAFKTPRLRRTFILLVLIWSSIALVYDGHNRNILNLANDEWNFYWMFVFGSLTEFPADILLILTLDRFGRRWLAFASLSLSGICSFIAATVPPDAWTATFIMAIASRFWVNVAFNIGLQYASELLPTVIRAQGVNIIHIMGYVASLVSPLIAQIGRTNPVLSLLLLGSVALAGGILSLFLSETLGEDLPNNLEEAEAFGKHQSFWNCPICAKPKPVEEDKIMEVPEAVKLRNSLRASSRGETYRSSIISNPSRQSRFGVALDPFPSEKSRLKRGYTR